MSVEKRAFGTMPDGRAVDLYIMKNAAGTTVEVMPYGAEACAQCEVIYEDFPGWKESTFGVTRWEDLPETAKRYLQRLSEVAGCPIAVVSTGPDRSQTIMLDNPFTK